MESFFQRWIRRARNGLNGGRVSAKASLREQCRLATAWETIEGTGGAIDVRLVGGSRLRLYGDSVLGEYICKHRFEQDEVQFLFSYLRSGDVFVDVGANIGLFSVIAGRRVGSRGKVFAFEPGRSARERLRENLRINRLENVEVFEQALSDDRKSLPLLVPGSGHDAFASFAQPLVAHSGQCEVVEATTWDELAATMPDARDITMMKIDVEGWETRALAGAAGLLERPDAPLLQVEFAEEAARNAGYSCAELYGQIEDFGYRLCLFDSKSGLLRPEPRGREYSYANLYGTKRLEADNRRVRAGWFGRRVLARIVDRPLVRAT